MLSKIRTHTETLTFQPENDFANYMRQKLMGGKVLMKKGVIPHKFTCQQGRFREFPQRLSSHRRWQKDIAAGAMMEYEEEQVSY